MDCGTADHKTPKRNNEKPATMFTSLCSNTQKCPPPPPWQGRSRAGGPPQKSGQIMPPPPKTYLTDREYVDSPCACVQSYAFFMEWSEGVQKSFLTLPRTFASPAPKCAILFQHICSKEWCAPGEVGSAHVFSDARKCSGIISAIATVLFCLGT